jgi:membrane protein
MNLPQRVRKAYREIRELHITTYAGYASYFLILSVFPALVLLLSLLRYTSLRPEDLLELVSGFLPDALHGYAWTLLSSASGNARHILSLSALAALWSAGKGIYGLMKGLNRVYGAQEHRSWLRRRLLCAVYMVLLLLVLLLTLVLQVFTATLGEFLQLRGGGIGWLVAELAGIRYFALVAIQTLLFSVLFMYLPDRKNGFWESLPGALLGSFGWMSISGLFSVYVSRFSGYADVYGSVYGTALTLLWLYICVNALFYGAVLNVYLGKLKENVDFS